MADALVLGGGLAGMLAVRALLGHVDTVTVVERDRYPRDPVFRPGVPQARHLHNLVAGGLTALEDLLPGIGDELTAAGARLVLPARDLVIHTATGWHHRFTSGARPGVSCTRPLLDHVVRTRVLAEAAASRTRLEVVEGAEAVGLLGGPDRVRGARVRERGTAGRDRDLAADLVVDATGRGSRAPRWFGALGRPAPDEEVVDAELAYATRAFRFAEAPGSAVFLHSEPALPRGASLLPVEDGVWLLTLSGFTGIRPPTDAAGFLAYTATLAHPHLSDLLAGAEGVSPVHGYLDTANRRRDYHARGACPDGLVVVGDALCSFNPVYGHGMTVAALHAVALRDVLSRRGAGPRAARAARRAVARASALPWRAATSADRTYLRSAAGGSRVRAADRATDWFVERLIGHTAVDGRIAEAVHGVFSLALPPARLLAPSLVLRVLLRRPGPALDAPPPPVPAAG